MIRTCFLAGNRTFQYPAICEVSVLEQIFQSYFLLETIRFLARVLVQKAVNSFNCWWLGF